MKDTLRLLTFALVIAGGMAIAMQLSSQAPAGPVTLDPEEISWIKFCESRGYEVSTDDPDVIDEYLDTWRGSTEEEAALAENEVKPC